MADEHHLTQTAHDRLTAELEDLRTRGRIDIADRIETARQHGDLKENAEYHAAKEEKSKMEARISQLATILEDAVIVSEDEGEHPSAVAAGCVVSIRFEGDDDVERYLVGSIEERHDELDVISPSSPMGAALLGAEVGATVAYEAPSGAQLRVEVVEITR